MNVAEAVCDSEREKTQWVFAAKNGNKDAAGKLVERYRPLIFRLAYRISAGFGYIHLREDLVQSGYIGLLRAIENFMPEKEASLSTYAYFWIVGEMKKTLKGAIDSSNCFDGMRKVKRMWHEIENEEKRKATVEEIARRCRMSRWQVVSLLGMKETEEFDDNADCFGNGFITREYRTYEKAEWRMMLDALPAIEQRVILLRYYRDLSQKETAYAIGRSQTQVSRLERQALDRLRVWFKE